MHKMLQEPADFPIREGAPTAVPKKAEMPSLSDFVYPVLMDVDPAQLVEDEFKNKHSQVFCWRMLKLISQVDLTTFGAPEPQNTRPFSVFEGNIEEQARILCKSFMKREILDHLPPDEDEIDGDEEDKEMDESDNNQLGEDQQENGHIEANGVHKGTTPVTVSKSPAQSKPDEKNSVKTTKAH